MSATAIPSPVAHSAHGKKPCPGKGTALLAESLDMSLKHKTPLLGKGVRDAAEIEAARAWLEAQIARARTIGFYTIAAEVTPAIAYVALHDRNAGNRNLRDSKIRHFERMIREGRWMLISQGISFAPDGQLNNGQHRLNAIVCSGMSVQMNITFGEPRAAFKVLDTQASRGGADTLHIMGMANGVALAAAARALRIIEAGGRGNVALGNDEVGEIVLAHPGLAEAVAPAARLNHRLKTEGRGLSVAGASIAYYFIDTRSTHRTLLPDFWEKLCTGFGLTGDRDPVVRLRAALNASWKNRRPGLNPAADVAALIIIAWNDYARGKKSNTVVWQEGSPFPVVR